MLPFRASGGGSKGQNGNGTGAAIASRWPLGELREADLHLSPRVDPANGWIGRVAAARVLAPYPVGPLLFVHHKPTWQQGFERERDARSDSPACGRKTPHVAFRTRSPTRATSKPAPTAASVRPSPDDDSEAPLEGLTRTRVAPGAQGTSRRLARVVRVALWGSVRRGKGRGRSVDRTRIDAGVTRGTTLWF